MQIKALDFFRVYGAILIFLCHLPWFNFPCGNIGVTLFFVLSGFVTNISSIGRIFHGYQYIFNKLKRLYPLYIVTTILGGIYMIFILHMPVVDTLIKFPIFATLLQTLIFCVSPTGFNGPGWYVATLFNIYILYLVVKKIKIKRFCKIIGFIIYSIFWLYILPEILKGEIYPKLNYFSPFSRIIDFGMGYIAAYLALAYRRLNIKPLLINSFEFCGVTLLCAITLYPHSFTYELLVLCFCLLYILFSKDNGILQRILSAKWICQLSKYTYSFYLIHYLVIMTVKNSILPYLFSHESFSNFCINTSFFIWITVGCLFISMVLSYLLNLYQSKCMGFMNAMQFRMTAKEKTLA